MSIARVLPEVPFESWDDYVARGAGGRGIARATELGPLGVIDELRTAGLRGRGGGGFPTGSKWTGVREAGGSRRFVVCNGAEGEPATFKDRSILRRNPYAVVEGLVIAAFAIEAEGAYIAVKASFDAEIDALTRAITEMQTAGVCADCSITIVHGPDEYLFGEEKAMLEVIEGNPPLPRLLPPYQHGLFASAPQTGWAASGGTDRAGGSQESNPTLVNNVETLAHAANILANGAEWFREHGTPDSPGTVVCTIVGDVQTDGVGEVAMGTTLRDAIHEIGGGPRDGRTLKAAFSGVANAVVTSEQFDLPLTYEHFASAGTSIGACGFFVLDDEACMVEAARQVSRFLYVESCGQCPPCKRGSSEITERLTNIEGGNGSDRDLADIRYWLDRVTDGNRCYLAVEEREAVSSVLRAFPEEFAQHIEGGRCPRPKPIPLPKILDIVDGRAVFDEAHYRKQPDWTYLALS